MASRLVGSIQGVRSPKHRPHSDFGRSWAISPHQVHNEPSAHGHCMPSPVPSDAIFTRPLCPSAALHAHGRLFDFHRVHYSIGAAGSYLLHVRLRKQAVSLPGSPFMLRVEHGPPHALSCTLPRGVIRGEVGSRCTITMSTSDALGNPCVRGGSAAVACSCSHSAIQADCTDLGDGSYELSWWGMRTGTFAVHVTIDGVDVQHSPARLVLTSTTIAHAKCEIHGDGLTGPVAIGRPASFHVVMRDDHGNIAVPDEAGRSAFRLGLALADVDGGGRSREQGRDESWSPHPFEGTWLSEASGDYEVTYIPDRAGAFDMHVWIHLPQESSVPVAAGAARGRRGSCQIDPQQAAAAVKRAKQQAHSKGMQDRITFPGSPFRLTVLEASQEETAPTPTACASKDYAVARSIFEDVQKQWGACSVDAFASKATALLPRYWTASPDPEAEGMDAMSHSWQRGERVWMHPPASMLLELTRWLHTQDRWAEFLVCVPYWPRQGAEYASSRYCPACCERPHRPDLPTNTVLECVRCVGGIMLC